MDDSTQITQDTTVTAQYNANTYTVKINPNGASGSTKTYTVTYGQKWNVPSCPFSRTGYTFSGYSGGYSAGQSITITGNVSINCNWSIKTYQVSISPNGASGSTKYYSVTYGSTWTVPSCPFTRSGYTFNGYSGGYSVGQRVTVTSNISISCQWTKQTNPVTVVYKSGSGSYITEKTTTVSYGSQTNINYAYLSYSGSDSPSTQYYFPNNSGTPVRTLIVRNTSGKGGTLRITYTSGQDPNRVSASATIDV